MPRIKYAEAPASRISVWVSCRDHDFPIVEICKGERGAYEAHLKLNLFDFSVVEVEGFSLAAVKNLVEELRPYKSLFLRDWYEITQEI